MLKRFLTDKVLLVAVILGTFAFGYWLALVGSPNAMMPKEILTRAKKIKTTKKIISTKSLPKKIKTNAEEQSGPEPESDLYEEADRKKVTQIPLLSSASEQFYQKLNNFEKFTLSDLNAVIEQSDKMIAEDPDSYAGYKAKLLATLAKEIQFKEEVSMETYEELYDQMLQFEADENQDTILEIALEDDLEGGLGVDLEDGSEEQFLSPAELAGIDNDLIHLPFIRLAGLGELEEMADTAEDYIETYPDSHIGYLYLAEALAHDGNNEEALSVLQEAMEKKSGNQLLLKMLEQSQANSMMRLTNMAKQLIPAVESSED